MEDTTVYRGVVNGVNFRAYYYFGNFYLPLFLPKKEKLKVDKAIRLFRYKNKQQVKQDRAHPNYKNLVELFDEQMGEPLNVNTQHHKSKPH